MINKVLLEGHLTGHPVRLPHNPDLSLIQIRTSGQVRTRGGFKLFNSIREIVASTEEVIDLSDGTLLYVEGMLPDDVFLKDKRLAPTVIWANVVHKQLGQAVVVNG